MPKDHLFKNWCAVEMHITEGLEARMCVKSHVGQLVVNLAVQEGSLVAGERGLETLLDENADWRVVSYSRI
jgi:hypothetical protein